MTEGECNHGKMVTLYLAQMRDAVVGVLTKRMAVSETCRELDISEHTLARWQERAVEVMELTLADKTERDDRGALLENEITRPSRPSVVSALENDLLGKGSGRLA